MTMNEPEREIGVNQRQLNDRVTGYSKSIIGKILNLAGTESNVGLLEYLPAGNLYSQGRGRRAWVGADTVSQVLDIMPV